MKRYSYTEPEATDPIRIEQVWAEKPAGGIVEEPGFDAPETTAVYADGTTGKFKVIKAYRLVAAVTSSDTTIKIAKGSGVVVGDIIGTAKKSVACTAVDKTNADYDLVTVTMGVAIANGTVLYQSGAASTSATPIGTPVYVTGNYVYSGLGDQPVRLINGANLRKQTANIAPEVAALMYNINLV